MFVRDGQHRHRKRPMKFDDETLAMIESHVKTQHKEVTGGFQITFGTNNGSDAEILCPLCDAVIGKCKVR
jgi:hypothetical protein